jgi:fructose-specific phosphotransferase system component IIB
MKFLGVCHHNMWEARLDKYNEKPMIQLTIETESAQGVLDKISLFSELTRID